MYVSGTMGDYAGRVHALAISGADLTLFEIEGYNYTGVWNFTGSVSGNLAGFNEKRIFLSSANCITQSGFRLDQLFTGTRYF